jgi:hypothetical protein
MKFDDIVEIGKRSEEGAWVDGLAHFNGLALKVRGAMNSDFEALFSKLWGPVPADKREDPEINDRIEKECIVKTILLDWKGIDDFPATPENVEKALEVRTFKQAVMTAARVVATRGRDQLEADTGN